MVENETQWDWQLQSHDEWLDEKDGYNSLKNIARGSMTLTNDDGYECNIEMSSLDDGDSDSSNNGNVSFWTYLYEDEKMFPRWSYETMTYWINGICIGNGEECLDEIYREDSQVRLKMDFETFAKIMLTIERSGEWNRYEAEKR